VNIPPLTIQHTASASQLPPKPPKPADANGDNGPGTAVPGAPPAKGARALDIIA
jgi:hypothetical protein